MEIPTGLGHEVLRRDPGLSGWLTGLPALVAELCEREGLVHDGPLAHGSTSLVVPVQRHRHRYALKITSPLTDSAVEARALQLMHGHGVVGLHDYFPDDNAILLDWLPEPTLVEHPQPLEALRIAGEICGRIATTPSPSGTASLVEGARAWHLEVQQQIAATSPEKLLPREVMDAALEKIRKLASSESSHLTHGDLSFANIVRSETGDWLAVDPGLVAGPATNEIHTITRSLYPTLLPETASEQIHTWTEIAASAAGVDARASHQLSLARLVASVLYEQLHDGDAANIQRLRVASIATWTLVNGWPDRRPARGRTARH